MSERDAVSTPRRSTHADEPRMDFTVSRFHAIGGTPMISM
jgi:hypothetical protein